MPARSQLHLRQLLTPGEHFVSAQLANAARADLRGAQAQFNVDPTNTVYRLKPAMKHSLRQHAKYSIRENNVLLTTGALFLRFLDADIANLMAQHAYLVKLDHETEEHLDKDNWVSYRDLICYFVARLWVWYLRIRGKCKDPSRPARSDLDDCFAEPSLQWTGRYGKDYTLKDFIPNRKTYSWMKRHFLIQPGIHFSELSKRFMKFVFPNEAVFIWDEKKPVFHGHTDVIKMIRDKPCLWATQGMFSVPGAHMPYCVVLMPRWHPVGPTPDEELMAGLDHIRDPKCPVVHDSAYVTHRSLSALSKSGRLVIMSCGSRFPTIKKLLEKNIIDESDTVTMKAKWVEFEDEAAREEDDARTAAISEATKLRRKMEAALRNELSLEEIGRATIAYFQEIQRQAPRSRTDTAQSAQSDQSESQEPDLTESDYVVELFEEALEKDKARAVEAGAVSVLEEQPTGEDAEGVASHLESGELEPDDAGDDEASALRREVAGLQRRFEEGQRTTPYATIRSNSDLFQDVIFSAHWARHLTKRTEGIRIVATNAFQHDPFFAGTKKDMALINTLYATLYGLGSDSYNYFLKFFGEPHKSRGTGADDMFSRLAFEHIVLNILALQQHNGLFVDQTKALNYHHFCDFLLDMIKSLVELIPSLSEMKITPNPWQDRGCKCQTCIEATLTVDDILGVDDNMARAVAEYEEAERAKKEKARGKAAREKQREEKRQQKSQEAKQKEEKKNRRAVEKAQRAHEKEQKKAAREQRKADTQTRCAGCEKFKAYHKVIGCDYCDLWWCTPCAGLIGRQVDLAKKKDSWACPKCPLPSERPRKQRKEPQKRQKRKGNQKQ